MQTAQSRKWNDLVNWIQDELGGAGTYEIAVSMANMLDHDLMCQCHFEKFKFEFKDVFDAALELAVATAEVKD